MSVLKELKETGAAETRYLALFESFEKAEASRADEWLRQLRRDAMDRFAHMGFPSPRTDEEWRFTDVKPITDLVVSAAPTLGLNGLAARGVDAFTFGLSGSLLVFVNGHYAPQLSQIAALPADVTAGSLAEAVARQNEVVQQHLAKYTAIEENAFTALNTAFVQDGAFIHVPNNVVVEEPLHLLFLGGSGDGAIVSHPRNLIVVGANAQVTIIEHYASGARHTYFTNAVSEVVAGPNAVIDHTKLQLESEEAFHVSTLQVQQQRDAHFSSLNVDLGGRLVRNGSTAVMGGQNIECTMNGLFLTRGEQHVDNHTVMDHAQPNCNSYEVYTGILGGQSRGVFNGKIFVRRDAQKTDAKQSNRNLLLSNEALVNTKPQLEIFADDVKCTHGATIGQLDEDALFYLRARGIPREAAQGILTFAFANEVIEGIKVEALRAHLEQQIFARLSQL